MRFDVNRFSEPVRSILTAAGSGGRSMPLAPRGPLEGEALTNLRAMTIDDLFEGEKIVSLENACCVRAALYLYLSALEESHLISQKIATPSGSFWHGVMHRQEPDYPNAKYWFRRAGDHPVLGALERSTGAAWDPFEFVDRCEKAEQVEQDGGERETLITLQRLEWQTLFEHCYSRAVGG